MLYLSSLRPRFSMAEVPGATTYVDSEQQLCKTRCFKPWQDALSRFNHNLHLGFDLVKGFWCVYRLEYEARRLDTKQEYGIELGYLHPVPAIMHYIAWIVDEDSTKPPKWYYRIPDERALEELAERPEASLDWDNGAYMAAQLTKSGEDREERSTARSKQIIDEIFDDAASRIDSNSTIPEWKPMISVPADL